MMSIHDFRASSTPSKLVMIQHGRKRCAERGIRARDIIDAINTGEIIEDYPDDTPYPSCLILGYAGERVLHVCASLDDESMIRLITAYSPDPAKWEADWKTRKEEKQ